MVAITVILAAVIGTFVLGLGDSISQNANAGVSYDNSTETVTVTSLGANTNLVECGANTESTSEVGGEFTCPSGSNIIAETDGGERTVILTNIGQ